MTITGSFWPMLAVTGFLIATWGASKLARLLGMSSIVLEVITGIVLGPECLGLMSSEYTVCDHQRHTECQPPDDWRGRLEEGLSLGSQLDLVLSKCNHGAFLLDLGGDLGNGGASGNASDATSTSLSSSSASSTTLEATRVTTTKKTTTVVSTTRTTVSSTTAAASSTTTTAASRTNPDTTTWRTTTSDLGSVWQGNDTTTTTDRGGNSTSPQNDSGSEGQLTTIPNVTWGADDTTTTDSLPRRRLATGPDEDLPYSSFEECLIKSCEAEVRAQCNSSPDLFTLIGRAGVALMIFESGMLFDFAKVQEVGRTAWFAALFGTICPLIAGSALVAGLGKPYMSDGISAGIALVPTSVAFAIRQLGECGVLQEPFSQALLAIAFVDEVISLLLFTILVNLAGEFDYLMVVKPLIGLILMPAALAAGSRLLPMFVRGVLLPKIPMVRDQKARLPVRMRLTRDEVLFLLMLCVLIVYAVISQLLGTHLWGCFIAGTTFASLDMPGHPGHALHVWVKQTKRVTTWMVRIFFACTVAFSIPVGDFFSIDAFWKGTVLGLFACIATKVCCALWMDGGCIIGWAMVNRAEFAFLIAQMAAGSNMLSQDTYCAVIWALLYAAGFSPTTFHFLLRRYVELNGIEDRGATGLGHYLSEDEEEDAPAAKGRDLDCVEEEMVASSTMKAPRSKKDIADVQDIPALEGCLTDLDEVKVKLEEVNPEQECLTEQCRDVILDTSKLEDGPDLLSVPPQKAPSEKKPRSKRTGKGTKNVKHAIFPGASPINTRGFLCCLFFRKIIVD